MSSGTHWRHICIMGHPGGLISVNMYFGKVYIYMCVCTSPCYIILYFSYFKTPNLQKKCIYTYNTFLS